MVSKKILLLFIVLGIVTAACGQLSQTQASTFNKNQALSVVKDAFNTQVSLSEKARTKKQIQKNLSQYLSNDLTQSFIKENVVEVDGGYQTFGSDFASYYIPFFSYDENTHVKYNDGKWYIWEERKGVKEGPVSAPAGVEAVILTEEEGKWKVSEITYDLPDAILSQ